jgi:outer membrane immunogenic protein
MKKILVAGIAVAVLCGTPALAADLPTKAEVFKAPIPAPVYSWTGCYIGGNVGYGWQNNQPYDPLAATGVGSDTGTGAVGGGQIGCDYQFAGKWVIGIQGMFDAAGVNGSHLVPFSYAGDNSETMTFKTSWFATLTGRIGYALVPQALLYAKGGAAWARTSYSDTDPSGAVYPPFSGQASATPSGWTVGGGVEYAFLPNWSVFVEYDYIGLGSPTVALSYNCGSICGSGINSFANPYSYKETQNLQAVLVGVNLRFGIGSAPLSAQY